MDLGCACSLFILVSRRHGRYDCNDFCVFQAFAIARYALDVVYEVRVHRDLVGTFVEDIYGWMDSYPRMVVSSRGNVLATNDGSKSEHDLCSILKCTDTDDSFCARCSVDQWYDASEGNGTCVNCTTMCDSTQYI